MLGGNGEEGNRQELRRVVCLKCGDLKRGLQSRAENQRRRDGETERRG